MNRIEWILTGLVALLFVAVIAVALVIWNAQYPEQPSRAAGSATGPSEVDMDHTAQSAFELALPIAQAWAGDAQLLSARASWSQETGFQPETAEWGFLFYSASRQESSLISVTGATARLVRNARSRKTPAAVDISNWEIDSPVVLETLLQNGGQEFIETHQQVSLLMGLEATDRLRWRARLFDLETNHMHIVEVDPTYGTVDTITPPVAEE